MDTLYTTSKALKMELMNEVHTKIKEFGQDKDKHYKYWIYVQLNPDLVKSPFLNRIDYTGKCITKFRVGSHNLKIETGRWNRTVGNDRLCTKCNEMGDEYHIIYNCSEIYRDDLTDLPLTLSSIWSYPKVNELFERIRIAGYIE